MDGFSRTTWSGVVTDSKYLAVMEPEYWLYWHTSTLAWQVITRRQISLTSMPDVMPADMKRIGLHIRLNVEVYRETTVVFYIMLKCHVTVLDLQCYFIFIMIIVFYFIMMKFMWQYIIPMSHGNDIMTQVVYHNIKMFTILFGHFFFFFFGSSTLECCSRIVCCNIITVK